jgi:coproporphyrinogen III oxidase-like Fe-S oxidoreductase
MSAAPTPSSVSGAGPSVPGASRSPLLLYVNVPFCNSKCHFCDWVVRVPIGDLRLGPESAGRIGHLAAIQTQISAQAPELTKRYRPELMYWGGGTASILSLDEIRTLHAAVAGGFPLGDIVEATIESSPESLTLEKLSLFRELGFNRISIGVQSFDDDRLRMIGRVHSAEGAEASISLARAAGFDNINIDLIVGFPDQDLAEVEDTVRHAISLPVNHFSIYPYRASQGTVLRRRLDRANVRTDLHNQLAAYQLAATMLTEHGCPEYSFGYFGDPVCIADMSYYQLQTEWIGFGSGSFSLIDGRMKGFAAGQLQRYIAQPTEFDFDRPLSGASDALHLISIALTTPNGIAADTFEQRAGIPLSTVYEHPEVQEYLGQLGEYAQIIYDDAGLRIARDDISRAFISMNWVDSPTESVPVELGLPTVAG